MKYGANVYFNTRAEAMLDGYRDGDTLQMSVVVLFPAGETPEEAAGHVFAALNADDRPNGKTERSLSVGDVVKIVVPPDHEGGTGYFVWLACEPVGWKDIAEPDA